METTRGSCDRNVLERFLVGQLADAARAGLEDHLEACAACRQELDALAADASWWDEARGYLSGSGLTRAEVTTDPAGEPDGDDPLPPVFGLEHYLAPTDDPRMLGRVGPYEVAGVVGCGGMGIVLKAFDAPLNRYVAIKVLAPHLALSAAARGRFAREAKAAAAVVHDNVVAIHAVSEARGMPYFVMPYVRGTSLEKRLKQRGPLPVVEVLRIGLQIAEGLAAAHAQGVVHRDIKPANILLEDGVERVTITDFGLARAADDASLTQSGVVAGTPQYMSPEQAGGRSTDHRSDLFSLGSVLYALCTGRPPFRAENTLAVLRRVEEDTPRPVREISPDVPEFLAGVIERLHAKDPAYRFASAAEVAGLLRSYLAHVQKPTAVPAPPLPPGPAAAPRFSHARWWLPLAAVILAVLAGVVAWQIVWPFGRPTAAPTVAEFHRTFDDRPENRAGFQLVGPDAEQCVKFEPAGLRITLPAGYDGPPGFFGERPDAGVLIPVNVGGNFEVAVGYEILTEPAPPDAGRPQTRFTLDVGFDRQHNAVATVSRRVEEMGGSQYFVWVNRWNAATGQPDEQGRGFTTRSKIGRLCLKREGTTLSYYASEGRDGPFVLLERYPVGADDPEDVRISASTGGPRAALDVRVFDVHVRADSLTDLTERSVSDAGKWWRVGVAATLFVAVAAGLILAAWHRRPARPPLVPALARSDAAPPLIFQCSGCGKTLKIKSGVAAKRVKCPECGTPVAITAIKPADRPGKA